MTEHVEITEMPSFFAAIIKVKTDLETIGDHHEKCFPQIMDYLQKNGVQPAGPPLNFYLQMENETLWEIGAGFPVATKMDGDGTIEVVEVPAGTIATQLHVGPYEELEHSWNAFEVWHREQGYKIEMEGFWCWESFLTYNTPLNESEPRIKLNWRL